MKHAKAILALGIIVAIVPFLGFPSSWKQVIFGVGGVLIAVLAFRIMARTRHAHVSETHAHKEEQSDTWHASTSVPDTHE